MIQRRQKAEWATKSAMPEIMRLADRQLGQHSSSRRKWRPPAFPGEPTFSKLWPALRRRDPLAGEAGWRRRLREKPEGAEPRLGAPRPGRRETALNGPIRVHGVSGRKKRLRDAYVRDVAAFYGKGTMPLSLAATGKLPPGMVRVDPPDTSAAGGYLNFLRYEGGPAFGTGRRLPDRHARSGASTGSSRSSWTGAGTAVATGGSTSSSGTGR